MKYKNKSDSRSRSISGPKSRFPEFNIAKILAVFVSIVGVGVMIGWILDIDVLKSILPQWVTMKFTTALCFLLGGIIAYSIVRFQECRFLKKRSEFFDFILPTASLIVFLIMATLLASIFLGIRTGIEDIFVKETLGAVKTATPGRPSAGTMVNFILIAMAGVLTMLNPKKWGKSLFIMGIVIEVVSLVAITGYILNIPSLYYTLENISTAMALHTAILFALLGICIFLVGKRTLKSK